MIAQLFLWMHVVSQVHAQTGGLGGTTGGSSGRSYSIANPLQISSVTDLLYKFIDIIFTISIPVSTIFIIWGAFLILSGGSTPENIAKGRNTILWAVAGFTIIALSKGILYFIQDFFK